MLRASVVAGAVLYLAAAASIYFLVMLTVYPLLYAHAIYYAADAAEPRLVDTLVFDDLYAGNMSLQDLLRYAGVHARVLVVYAHTVAPDYIVLSDKYEYPLTAAAAALPAAPAHVAAETRLAAAPELIRRLNISADVLVAYTCISDAVAAAFPHAELVVLNDPFNNTYYRPPTKK